MKSKAGKDLGYILRKTMLVSSLAIPLFFAGCKKDDPPILKSIGQSVDLNNSGVEIEYSAKVSNVDKAKLEVKREGVLISNEQISDVSPNGADYQKTYSYDIDSLIKKGDYEFTLTSDNLQKKDNVTIPDYPATVSYGNINLNENSEKTVPLVLDDKNPEDHPITAKDVKSLDGKVEATLDGNNLKIKAPSNYYGPYQLELELKNAEGGLEKKTLQGNIIKDTRTVINPFVSPDLNGAEYNSLTTKTDRDSFIQTKLNQDWVSTITFSTNPPWNCNNFSMQLFVNSTNLGEKIRTPSSDLGKYWLYNNYMGNDPDSIKYNHGTLGDGGEIGAPIIIVSLVDTTHHIHNSSYFGHGMNAILTGDNLTKWEDWNFIEPQNDQTKLQPGQADIPGDCDEVLIGYLYLVKDKENYLKYADLVKFRIENGTPILIWENNDPDFNIIKQRGK